MTKLVIQIPAYNEAETLPAVLAEIPRGYAGVDEVLVLVVDDGSSDGTAQIALANGADLVLRHRQNRGLSKAFLSGVQLALALGADVIVNTDADHQYSGEDIARLIAPVLSGEADIVIGDRQPLANQNFSPLKRLLESVGSWFVRRVSATDVPDAASGFRAYSRYTALALQVNNPYSYTLETLIQAGKNQWKLAHVSVRTNPSQRASRLHKGIFHFLWHQGGAIIRSYVMYQPLRTFLSAGMVFIIPGLALLVRFVYFYLTTNTAGRYLQSVSIGGTLVIAGIVLILIAFLGDSIRANRKLMEELLIRQRDQTRVADLHSLQEFLGQPIYTREHPAAED